MNNIYMFRFVHARWTSSLVPMLKLPQYIRPDATNPEILPEGGRALVGIEFLDLALGTDPEFSDGRLGANNVATVAFECCRHEG